MASDTDVYQALTQIEFFRDFSRNDVDELLRVGQWVKFTSGQSIMAEGDDGREMYVLVRGESKVVKNGKVLAELKPGDCFGEISAITQTPRTAHVISKGACYCLRFEAIHLHQLPVTIQLQIYKKLLTTLAHRLAALNRRFAIT